MAYNRGKTGRKYDVIYALFALVLGMFLAWVTGDIGGRGLIGNVLVHYGIWLFAGSLLAFYADLTAKHRNDLLDQRKPKSVALRGMRSIALIELFKDMLSRYRGHAAARV